MYFLFQPSKADFKPQGVDKMIGVMSKRGDVRYVFPGCPVLLIRTGVHMTCVALPALITVIAVQNK